MTGYLAPFRYAGGKRRMLPHILSLIPSDIDTYIEPFLGSGAVFYNLPQRPASTRLSDIDADIVNVHTCLRDTSDTLTSDVMTLLATHTPSQYYDVRARLNLQCLTPRVCAAYTLYLLATGYNGVWRRNRRGGYNTGVGSLRPLSATFTPEVWAECSARLQGVAVDRGDALAQIRAAPSGAFIFIDPPYLNCTLRYGSEEFGMREHTWLADEVRRAVDMGVRVMVTHSDIPEIRYLYRDLHCTTVQVSRTAGPHTRVGECVFRSYQ